MNFDIAYGLWQQPHPEALDAWKNLAARFRTWLDRLTPRGYELRHDMHDAYTAIPCPVDVETWAELANGPAGLRCLCCDLPYAERRRMDTAYENDESNYTVECPTCFENTQAHWAEMWQEHWNNVRG